MHHSDYASAPCVGLASSHLCMPRSCQRGTILSRSLIHTAWGLNLAASQARGRRTDQQDHLQGENSIECDVTGGSTINWEDAGIYAGSVFSDFVALLAAWAEDQMLSQIKALEKNGLTVRSLHGPCALLERCTAQRQPATLGNEYRTSFESPPHR